MTVKKMTEEQIVEEIGEAPLGAVAAESVWDDSDLYDGNVADKIANDDLPEGVTLTEQVSVSILMTPVGPRIFLSGTVSDPDRAAFLLGAGHKVAMDNSVEFYLGLEDEDDDDRTDLEIAADEAGHAVVADGYGENEG